MVGRNAEMQSISTVMTEAAVRPAPSNDCR